MKLFIVAELTAESTELRLSEMESKHIIRVLRQGEGDVLQLTNGLGLMADAEIILANPKRCMVRILKSFYQKDRDYKLHMAVAPTKNNDRVEWFLEKGTEIGIDKISFIQCFHSERKRIKMERFHKVVESAVKQSLKSILPILEDLQSFSSFLNNLEIDTYDALYIAHCAEDPTKSALKKEVIDKRNVLILIGPEGDFSNKEIELAKEKGFKTITLGKQRLRTETAALVALHTTALMA